MSMSSLTPEQELMRESAARVVRAAGAQGPPQERDPADVWRAVVELGWSALPFAEADAGLGGSVADLCLLARELGRGLLAGSFNIGTILPGRLVSAAPPSALRTRLLEELISGARTLALADLEPHECGGWHGVMMQARESGDGWILDGTKTNIWSSSATRRLLVSAAASEQCEMLLAVELGSPGLAVREFHTVDRGRAMECAFTAARVPESAVLIRPQREVRDTREAAWDCAAVVLGAECAGMMSALTERTAEHLRSRRQFGRPLAEFQALRHRLAEMARATRQAEVLVDRVAHEFADLCHAQRSRLTCAVCVKSLGGAKWVAEQAVQLHGGMGVTAELPIGLYLRRVLALQATFGAAEHHRARFQGYRL